MLAIRLRKTGSKKRPFFRVVVADSRVARDSSFVEVLGFYNPRTNPETLKLDRERLAHWVGQGAVASDTIRTLVARMPEPGEEPIAAPAKPASADVTAPKPAAVAASAPAEAPADKPADKPAAEPAPESAS